jgi:hypothetical protein
MRIVREWLLRVDELIRSGFYGKGMKLSNGLSIERGVYVFKFDFSIN